MKLPFMPTPAAAATLALALGLVFGGCSKKSDDGSGPGRMEIRLTDAPGDYQAVDIDVQRVEVHVADNEEANGWQTLTLVRPGLYNLLDLTNGNSALLTSADFPAGNVSQIRLVLGDNNTVTTRDGETYPLKVPSGAQSGLKLKVNAMLVADVTYQLLLDFDVAKSIHDKGGANRAEKFKLKPVIRVITTAIAGGIRGTVTPVAARPSVMAIRTTAPIDTFSTFPDATGAFLLRGLAAGAYRVEFTAPAPYRNVMQQTTVTVNQITNLGNVDVN